MNLRLSMVVMAAMVCVCACQSTDKPPAADKAAAQAPDPAKDKAKPQKPAEPSIKEPARQVSITDKERAYPNNVGAVVDSAISEAVFKAMDAVSDKVGGKTPAQAAGEQRPKGKVLTFWYTGNVRGEREDCGCKKNPRGGLTRKATLIDQAPKSGREIDRPDAQLIVDSGDLLFSGVFIKRMADKDKKNAMIRAEAIVASFNAIGCQAFLPGEYDLALGVDALMKLKSKARFPWISANLKKKGDKDLLLPAFTVTEAAGHKILFVGVTNPDAGRKNHYEEAGAEVLGPKAALLSQVDAIAAAKADAVVLLSNLGIEATSKLLRSLPKDKLAITMALVSNTARSTYTPIWADGIPILESGNRGKTLGRIDMHVVDGKFAFRAEEESQGRLVRNYANAYRSVHNARRSLAVAPATNDAARTKRLERNLRLAVERLAKIEATLPTEVKAPSQDGDNGSWLHPQIVSVLLDIKQDPKVRRLIDSYEAKTSK